MTTSTPQTQTQDPTVVIAEDSVLLRDGLVRLLGSAGFTVADACPDAETFLRSVAEHEPDLVVVDVRMPPTFTSEGIRAALVVREQHPETAVMVLSQYVEEQYATELVASRSTGVGYLLKDRVADTNDFLAALREVHGGGTVLDPFVGSGTTMVAALKSGRPAIGIDRHADYCRHALQWVTKA